MSLTLQPQASFTVVRQIANHLDTDTLYVQAVVRNAYTDAIITTLNLDDKGSQRFSKNWQVPADPSGQGFYISIVTSVYTDSGYTTKSPNYGDEENTYLIQERVLKNLGGGGASIYDIRRVIQEELKAQKEKEVEDAPEVEDTEEPEEVDTRPDTIISLLNEVKTAISALPKEKTELYPVINRLEQLRVAIDNKPVTPATDLKTVTTLLQALNSKSLSNQEIQRLIQAFTDVFNSDIKDTLAKSVAEATPEAMKSANFNLSFPLSFQQPEMNVSPGTGQPKANKKEEQPFDVSKYAL